MRLSKQQKMSVSAMNTRLRPCLFLMHSLVGCMMVITIQGLRPLRSTCSLPKHSQSSPSGVCCCWSSRSRRNTSQSEQHPLAGAHPGFVFDAHFQRIPPPSHCFSLSFSNCFESCKFSFCSCSSQCRNYWRVAGQPEMLAKLSKLLQNY